MTTLCVISARGGSRGLPGKNIRPLLEKPLIIWSIEQALATPEIDRVVVSTDSEEIAEVARTAGAETPFVRPDYLSSSEAGKFDVFKHALASCESYYGEEYEFYLDLDCTNPLRDVSDISACIYQFRKRRGQGVDGVFTICSARKNPYFNLLEKDDAGALKICKKLQSTIVRRQDAPSVYEHVAGIYVLSPDYIRKASHLLEGYTEGYDIGSEKSLDVDSDFDFLLIEYLMKRKLVHLL
ncbi:acylneuraminate cytidylyltransferase family protein [Chlorobium phaeovibrioides]|uniref:acylneuraminate cytidylyltransferase family protein n=1 Tax=Chlorobium phaeovibrioides TaxID=1094 RepID=UPI000F843F8A|nr:acylneuraminate cytidylyltransferase family protein [Chlorobium phaeovibrioides]RTY34151.1 acylneuraminate cytidylyltransferase family protein [Chlorobium phaeovibrioides]